MAAWLADARQDAGARLGHGLVQANDANFAVPVAIELVGLGRLAAFARRRPPTSLLLVRHLFFFIVRGARPSVLLLRLSFIHGPPAGP